MKPLITQCMVIAALCIAGCGTDNESTVSESKRATPAMDKSVSIPGPMDAWLGQWHGPEGTFLSISKLGAGYGVTIQSLDGPSKYVGRAVQNHIEFVRNGKTESIRATDGQATGMKWLADKKTCLTINVGEGFCRD